MRCCLAFDINGPDRPLFNLCHLPEGHEGDHRSGEFTWPRLERIALLWSPERWVNDAEYHAEVCLLIRWLNWAIQQIPVADACVNDIDVIHSQPHAPGESAAPTDTSPEPSGARSASGGQ